METLEDKVIDLNNNVTKLLEQWKNVSKWRWFISYISSLAFVSMLILTPVLAVIGNIGGAAILGIISIIYFLLRTALSAVAIYYIAHLDAETQKVTKKSRDSYERLGEKKYLRG